MTTKMAKIIKPLTTKEINEAKPKDREYRLYDGDGLMICIRPSGKKVWRLNYINGIGKRTLHTIGEFGIYSLVEARAEALAIKKRVSQGKSAADAGEVVFKDIFYEWLEKKSFDITPKTYTRYKNGIERHCFPVLENMPVSKIGPKDIVAALSKMEDKGIMESLFTLKSVLAQTLSCAEVKELCVGNAANAVSNSIFRKQTKKSHRHLKPGEIYQINKIFNGSRGSIVTRLCIEMTLRSMCRVSEVAKAKWSEIDIENRRWIIPAERMKMREEHTVFLSTQMISLLEKIEKLRATDYVFPSVDFKSHTSTETMRMLVVRCGIDSTIHGFRHLASTTLNEAQKNNRKMFDSEVIEIALAHKNLNTIKIDYDKAEYVSQRRELLQWWSDFIDKCDTKDNNERALKEAGISLI